MLGLERETRKIKWRDWTMKSTFGVQLTLVFTKLKQIPPYILPSKTPLPSSKLERYDDPIINILQKVRVKSLPTVISSK